MLKELKSQDPFTLLLLNPIYPSDQVSTRTSLGVSDKVSPQSGSVAPVIKRVP